MQLYYSGMSRAFHKSLNHVSTPPSPTYTFYQFNDDLTKLLLETIPGFQPNPFYFYQEIIKLAEVYIRIRNFPNDGQRIKCKGDKIVDLIHTEFIGANTKSLWRTLFPLLKVVTVQLDDTNACERQINNLWACDSVAFTSAQLTFPSNEQPTAAMAPRERQVSKVIKVEKPSLIDDEPSSSGYFTATRVGLAGTSTQSQPANKKPQKRATEVDVKTEGIDETEGPPRSKKMNVSRKQQIMERQWAEQRAHSAKVLSTQPVNTSWFYIIPRPGYNEDVEDALEEDDYFDTETVAYDDVAADDLDGDLDCCEAESDTEGEIKLIDEKVDSAELMKFRRRLNTLHYSIRVREEITDAQIVSYDNRCDEIDYDSGCDEDYWQCQSCPEMNVGVSAFCQSCWLIRPSIPVRPSIKNRKVGPKRPNALKLAPMQSCTTEPYNWLDERTVGNVHIWDLLGHDPPPNFDKNQRAVAGPVSKRALTHLRYPMFVVPKRRSYSEVARSDQTTLRGLPDLDEVKSGDTVNIVFAINPGLCLICEDNDRDALLIHEDLNSHVCCYSCAMYLQTTGRDCPFCRQKILLITQNNYFNSAKATVR